MTLLGYDSTRPELIPHDAEVIFPYCDGDYAWHGAQYFPKAMYRYITVLGDPDAAIADYETGDIGFAELEAWSVDRNRKHPDAAKIVYCERAKVAEVKLIMHPYKWHLFLTTLDGSRPAAWEDVPVSFCQITGGIKAPYDISVINHVSLLNLPR